MVSWCAFAAERRDLSLTVLCASVCVWPIDEALQCRVRVNTGRGLEWEEGQPPLSGVRRATGSGFMCFSSYWECEP